MRRCTSHLRIAARSLIVLGSNQADWTAQSEIEPVHLQEDETTGDRFLVCSTDKGIRLDIRCEGETLSMTQAQIAQLFGVDRSVITKHAEGELDSDATRAKLVQVRQEGARQVERASSQPSG